MITNRTLPGTPADSRNTLTAHNPWRFCVAPMMKCTDRHFRYFARVLSRHARLYTEMVVASAIVRGDTARFLAHDASEAPLALQLGGSDPLELAAASRLGAAAGYSEINLNVGCPSERVQSGRFGACLIAEPALVADCVAAMVAAVSIPVTVKTRLGVDQIDSYEHLAGLIEGIAHAGCNTVILHARKALLRFGTHANRTIPPLDYQRVYRAKRDFPMLTIVINGGIGTLDEALRHLEFVDGVMLGRSPYDQPYLLAGVDSTLFDDPHRVPNPEEALAALEPYIATQLANGVYLKHMSRHLLGYWQGRPGAKRWRRILSERGAAPQAGLEVLHEAMAAVR